MLKTGMSVTTQILTLHSCPGSMLDITREVDAAVKKSGVACGLVNVFCRHTSCSLVIMENADPTARRDLERYLDRLVPEDDPDFQHQAEGPDDMPSHIKMALTRTCETIPLAGGALMLGTWQGIFLWEHRAKSHRREIVVTVIGS